MNVYNFVAQITNEAVLLTILISLPTIAASLAIGLTVAIFSATTQIQEQTLSFAPKMIAVYGVLALTSAWMGGLLLRFAAKCLGEFGRVVS